MSLGERIRYCRIQRGLSQEQLSRSIGMEPGVISNYENDKYKPSADTVVALARSLYTSTDFLLLDEELRTLKDTIPDEEWLNLFLEVMTFPPEEKEAIKIVLKSLVQKNKKAEVSIT